ncbi:MAG: hypothetical protein K9J13_05755 [Saprospiraceae bacterium]|nr:hypothetical protein [Saprospiraceae bacterium]
MKIPKKIYRLNKKLKKASKKLGRYEEFGDSRDMFLKFKNRQIKINNKINELLVPILENENQEFLKIADENYSLLITKKFKFKITANGLAMYGSYTDYMEGRLNANGHIYCESKKTNFPYPFSSYKYPKRMEGFIDCLGNVSLETVKTGAAFIKRLPVLFDSVIEPDGYIKIFTTEREGDFLTGGDMYISNIIGNPFYHREKDRETFNSNRNKLLSILNKFRDSNNIMTVNKK